MSRRPLDGAPLAAAAFDSSSGRGSNDSNLYPLQPLHQHRPALSLALPGMRSPSVSPLLPWLVGAFLVLHTTSITVVGVPWLRFEEAKLCTSYYLRVDPSVVRSDGNVPETLCKVAPVQAEMAAINGSLALLDGLLGTAIHALHALNPHH